MAVSLRSGYIVWANGPFPCALYPDLKIFNCDLRQILQSDELILCDHGYTGRHVLHEIPGTSSLSAKYLARQETVNRRLKHFNVLSNTFRHDISLHSFCFHAIVNLTQLMLRNSDPLFEVYD